jgi:hypothetical protein
VYIRPRRDKRATRSFILPIIEEEKEGKASENGDSEGPKGGF